MAATTCYKKLNLFKTNEYWDSIQTTEYGNTKEVEHEHSDSDYMSERGYCTSNIDGVAKCFEKTASYGPNGSEGVCVGGA